MTAPRRDRSRDSRGEREAPKLTPRQHSSKERILTQHEPSKTARSTDALVLKRAELFLLCERSGDVPWCKPHALGLFFQDCRFLDGYALTFDGIGFTALAADDAKGYKTSHHLANPTMENVGGQVLDARTVGVVRRRILRGLVLHEQVTVTNFADRRVDLTLRLRFRSSFDDLFVLKGFVADRGDAQTETTVREREVVLAKVGLDGRLRETALRFGALPARIDGEHAEWKLAIEPGGSHRLVTSITPSIRDADHAGRSSARPDPAAQDEARHARAEEMWLHRVPRISSSSVLFDRVMRRALLDLQLLRSTLDGLHYFAAGVPWFATLFGRDAATIGIQTLPFASDLAGETARLLARYQAVDCDEYRDAEPGKILHELRRGELAGIGEIPQSPAYYGSLDATLLFLILIADYVDWSADLELVRELQPSIDAALDWIDRFGDHDGDGYLDYAGEYGHGLVNQGWKDSGNAIVDEKGRIATPPIALCEVQGYLFHAWRRVAAIYETLGRTTAASELRSKAASLQRHFEDDFWDDDLGCYVLALQEGGRPLRVVSSNAGQVLWSGLPRPERAERVARRLLEPDMFSGWGIRTLSTEHPSYNPMSYHLGSVWPHDNGIIASGFVRYGHREWAVRVFDALFEAATSFSAFRVPELFCGYARGARDSRPIAYPVACSPQGWAAASLPHALWNLLGLRSEATHGRLRIVDPCLPAGLVELCVRDLRVGDASVDLVFRRSAREVEVEAVVRAGSLHVDVAE